MAGVVHGARNRLTPRPTHMSNPVVRLLVVTNGMRLPSDAPANSVQVAPVSSLSKTRPPNSTNRT